MASFEYCVPKCVDYEHRQSLSYSNFDHSKSYNTANYDYPIQPSSRTSLNQRQLITQEASNEIYSLDNLQKDTKNCIAPYDQALTCFERCKDLSDEISFHIKMSAGDWIKFQTDLDLLDNEKAYPKCSYNTSTSMLIIQSMASPVHESIIEVLSEGFQPIISNYRRTTGNIARMSHNEDRVGFNGPYEGSVRIPDLAFEVEPNGSPSLKWVLEVGVSETYKDLVNDAKLWLEGNRDTSLVVLVKFQETPQYRCPFHIDINDQRLRQLGIPQWPIEVVTNEFTLVNDYGPVMYKGYEWVGELSEAFLEIWDRDIITGKAKQASNRINLLQTVDLQTVDLQFRLSDIIPIEPENDQWTTIDWAFFRRNLQSSLIRYGALRCKKLLINHEKNSMQSARN